MTASIPPWARALLAADRAVHSTVRLAALVRSELLLAGLAPAARDAVTASVFDKEDTYAPGGPTFSHGLFEWERAALSHAAFPRKGRVLLGGAGGGRELEGLASMGYEVVAFEPAPALSDALATVARRHPGARSLRGSYADLIDAAAGRGGPLASLHGMHFDALVLGWASLSHLTDPAQRRSLFDALRTIAPDAPVLASYVGPDEDGRANGRVERLRAPVRRLLARTLRRGAVVDGHGFEPGAGFYQRLAPDAFETLARTAGYEVAQHAREPYPHAILVPRAS